MKFFAALLLLATLAQARPRFLVIPIEDVEFLHHRVARAAWPQGPGPADGPGFAIPDSIRLTEGQLASGSGPSPAIAGGDAVDYGAYTGGYGAFGWYSDHPNHDGIGHRR